MVKLTKPQADLLRDVAEGKRSCSTSYKPAQKLAEAGYCVWRHGSLGGTWLDITEAGRAAISRGGQTE